MAHVNPRKSKRKSIPDPDAVLRALAHRYGGPGRTRDPFRVLASTVLSQRVRDRTTESVSEKLFARYPTPKSLADADLAELEKVIRESGFFRQKAKNLKAIAEQVISRYGGETPADVEELLTLPGVGRKTANCVMVYGFGRAALPVDTHVHRISNRLGWVRTRTPEETETALTAFLPKRMWLPLNHAMVEFGKDLCRPVRPRCADCPVARLGCPSAQTLKS